MPARNHENMSYTKTSTQRNHRFVRNVVIGSSYLKQHHGSKEHVHHRHQEQEGKARHQRALKSRELKGGHLSIVVKSWKGEVSRVMGHNIHLQGTGSSCVWHRAR